MPNQRRPIFELHIRPMFRLIDKLHMSRLAAGRRIDLADYQQVREKHVRIKEIIEDASPMPTTETGGPWPQEWVDLFNRWTVTDFGQLARPVAMDFQLRLTDPDRYTLSCGITLPNAGTFAWFDAIEATANSQIYAVVMEVAEGVPPTPTPFTIEDRIRGPLTVPEIVVQHGGGEQRITLPTA